MDQPLLDRDQLLKQANERLKGKGLPPLTWRTIRYWVKAGVIDRPKRSGARGRSHYSADFVHRLVGIRQLQSTHDLSLKDIAGFRDWAVPPEKIVELIERGVARYGEEFAQLIVPETPILADRELDQEVAWIWINYMHGMGDRWLERDEAMRLMVESTGITYDEISKRIQSQQIPSHSYKDEPIFLQSEIQRWIGGRQEATAQSNYQPLRETLLAAEKALSQVNNLKGIPDPALVEILKILNRLEDWSWTVKRRIAAEERERHL